MYLSSLIYHLYVRWRESEDTLPTCKKLRVSSLRIKSTFKLQVLFNILNCLQNFHAAYLEAKARDFDLELYLN